MSAPNVSDPRIFSHITEDHDRTKVVPPSDERAARSRTDRTETPNTFTSVPWSDVDQS